MESGISTLKNISVLKCAVLLSLSKELKREILCVPGSEYDKYKFEYQYHRKWHWNDIVERKAKEILNHRQLPENLQEKLLSILLAVGLRMLSWAEYHEGTLGLTRYYSLIFLRNSHFTFQGLIDNKKAAEEMIKDVNLSIKQRYKLACIYCFENQIFTIFKEIVEDEKNLIISPDCKWMQKPEIVKYWTSHLTNMVHVEAGTTPHYLYMLGKSIKTGSKEAVKYSLEKRCRHSRENALIYGVTEVLKMISPQSDWIVFRDQRFDDSKESWAPNYFYLDILCFLLSNMTKDQQKKALEENTGKYIQITVLEMFLCWPYQGYFMKIAAVLWDLIPQEIYPYILFSIVDNVEVASICEFLGRISILYGEEKSYDCKKLLKDFWSESPDHFKRIVFTNTESDYWGGVMGFPNEVTIHPLAKDLVLALITLKTFTYEDEEIIRLILSSATLEEKTILTSAEWWKSTTRKMLEKENFEFFDRLLLVFCTSNEEVREFKNKVDFFNIARSVLNYFLKYCKLNALKSLIQRMSLKECELLSIKYDIIFSSDGMQYCRHLLISGKYKDFEECIKWFLPSKNKAMEYKRALALNIQMKYENSLAERFPVDRVGEIDILDLMTRLTRSKISIREAINGIQTSVDGGFGIAICEDLIAGSSFEVIYEQKNSLLRVKTEFTGGQWERVDEFLRWSFCTEKKILEFKKNIFEVSGHDIHFQLIKAKKWKEAKRFFDWLRLSADEIKDLKRRTILYFGGWQFLLYSVLGEDEMNYLETIDLFLRWNLTDKRSVIKFRDEIFKCYREVYDESLLMKFIKIVQKYLNDLDEEESYTRWNPEEVFFMKLKTASSKRRSTVLSPQKKIRLSTSMEEETRNGNTGNSNRRRSQRLLNRVHKL